MIAPGQTTTVLLATRSSLRQLHRNRLHPLVQIHPTRLLPSYHPPPQPPRATRHHLRHRLLRQAPEPRLRRVPVQGGKRSQQGGLPNDQPQPLQRGPDSKRLAASMNNQSFVRSPISMLQSYYSRNSTLLEDFPERPANPFDYTAKVAAGTNMNAEYGARLLAVAYGARMEVVLQDTSFINAENHPIHVHGRNFFVVGRGFGNFERERDRKRYNLEDPPERNTVAAPSGGWAAIRLTADNPGVWFVHCHLEVHTTWGLAVGFVVENAPGVSQSILPPPDGLPRC